MSRQHEQGVPAKDEGLDEIPWDGPSSPKAPARGGLSPNAGNHRNEMGFTSVPIERLGSPGYVDISFFLLIPSLCMRTCAFTHHAKMLLVIRLQAHKPAGQQLGSPEYACTINN